MSTNLSRKTERAAKKAFAAKEKKYKQIATDNRLSFLPLIFESSGRPAETTVKFLKSMAKHAAEVKKINVNIVFSYMMTRLSCVIQRCVANSLNTRVNNLNSHATKAAARAYIVSADHVNNHKCKSQYV